MKKKSIWLVVSCLMVAALVLASCGPAAVEEEEAASVEGEEARNELINIRSAVIAMMVDNQLSELPNPVTVATNDMSAFPDTSVCGVDKIYDPDGNEYVRGQDKDGYILYGHDKLADGGVPTLVTYLATRYAKDTYTVDKHGEVTQVTPTEREVVTPEESAEWETHTYRNKEMGYALSFATPSKWLATGPVGERKLGGWYDPAYAKPPSPDAVWCYWITCSPPGPEPGDPLILAPSQKRVATQRVQGDWSYHLMCVAPTAIFDEQTAVFNRIMESLKPLP